MNSGNIVTSSCIQIHAHYLYSYMNKLKTNPTISFATATAAAINETSHRTNR